MKNPLLKGLRTGLIVAAGVLAAALLVYLRCVPNVETEQSRGIAGYQTLQAVSYREREEPTAPIGMVREYRFRLKEELVYDTSLIFRFSHQNAQVYLDGKQVYSLRASDRLSIVRTAGVNWAMIPLLREDAGREVCVVLTPVYADYRDQEIEFYVGSKLAVYTAQLVKTLPELLLSLINVIIGLLLLCGAIYFSAKGIKNSGVYALAMLAISLGLWNFTQTDFAPFILPSKNVFVYYVSLVMLLLCAVPLTKSVRAAQERADGITEIWCILCGTIITVQLVLQLCGVLDLRQMLKLTHAMIAVSALAVIVGSMLQWRSHRKNGQTEPKMSCVWLLGVGALLDMGLYYLRDGSTGLVFVLLAIACYVLSEGARLLLSFARQRQMLAEKEIQLTLSRTTTMMSQIRSHFVFNILNAISGMCKYDPEKADETVVRFARYLRNNIDIMEDDKPVPFATELERLEDYVLLEQVRFGEKIDFCTEIGVDDFRLPPLLLQPAVENAIKHGLIPKEGGGTVVLRTWEDGENIKLRVEDDGVGFDMTQPEKEKSVGLKNIRYRLHHLVHGTLEIESRVGVGTVVTITVPKGEARR